MDSVFRLLRCRPPGLAAFVLLGLAVLACLPPARAAHAQPPLHLVFENQTFNYNLEHTSIDELDNGFTLTGNLLKTYFRYDIKPGLRIEAGALLDIPFGADDRVDRVEPVVSLHYAFLPNWLATAGTLNRNHPLHDAFFDDVLRYTEPIEQGFQIRGAGQHFLQDSWISWETREEANRREKFSVGHYTQLKWNGFMLDLQGYWVHLGGQQNSEPCCFNNLSLGAGGGYTFRPSHEGFLDEMGFTVHYLYNKDIPADFPTVDEDGVAALVFVQLWGFRVSYQWWEGGSPDFNSAQGDSARPGVALAKGDPLYRTSDYEELRLLKIWRPADEVSVELDFRAQFVDGGFVQAYGFNFTWTPSFPLFPDSFSR